MAKKKKIQPPPKKRFPFIPLIAGVFALGIIVAAAGFAYAANMESKDAFCSSCHTQPETTFFERSTAESRVDLASYHQTKQTHCIDCHSGSGVVGRVQAELTGAHNAFAFYTGTAIQPGKLAGAYPDENCLKCHQKVTARTQAMEEGGEQHWHAFLTNWQAQDPNAATCVSCHPGHSTDVAANNNYQNIPETRAVCNACHQALRE
jgi:hypothetical protein